MNALGFPRRCYRVIGQLRARQLLGETPFLDEVSCASFGYERTWKLWPDREKPSNKWAQCKALADKDLGLFVDGIVGHLDERLWELPGLRFCA